MKSIEKIDRSRSYTTDGNTNANINKNIANQDLYKVEDEMNPVSRKAAK